MYLTLILFRYCAVCIVIYKDKNKEGCPPKNIIQSAMFIKFDINAVTLTLVWGQAQSELHEQSCHSGFFCQHSSQTSFYNSSGFQPAQYSKNHQQTRTLRLTNLYEDSCTGKPIHQDMSNSDRKQGDRVGLRKSRKTVAGH